MEKMEKFTAEVVEGMRKGSNLIWIPEEKYLYSIKDVRGDGPNQRKIHLCYENKKGGSCPARRIIDSNGHVTTNSLPHSNHSNHELYYKDMKTRSDIINTCAQTATLLDGLHQTVPSQQIFTRELAKRKLGESSLSYNRMARNIRRYTNTKYPAMPKDTTEIKLAYRQKATMREFGLNLRNTSQFYVDTAEVDGNEFTLFASYDMIDMVEEHIPPELRRYMIDGTFDVVPIRYFHQLLVIAIEYKNDLFPLFFVLMTNKTAKAYENLFKYIEENVFKLQPAQFMADFEKGLRKAITICFPDTPLYGCWYHYCAAIRRRLMTLSMYRVISDDSAGAMIYRMFLSLPLLPRERILDGFEFIKLKARKAGLFNTFKAFFKYFDNFWRKLNDTSSLSVAHLLNRTSSPLEALNSILNRSIAKRTHFFRFVGRLRVFESKKSNDMASAVNSQSSQFSSGNKKYQMRNKKIKELTKAFDSGGIDVEGFLESMSSDPYRDVHEYYDSELDSEDENDDEEGEEDDQEEDDDNLEETDEE